MHSECHRAVHASLLQHPELVTFGTAVEGSRSGGMIRGWTHCCGTTAIVKEAAMLLECLHNIGETQGPGKAHDTFGPSSQDGIHI